jgi:hypothetical protein
MKDYYIIEDTKKILLNFNNHFFIKNEKDSNSITSILYRFMGGI